MHGEILKGEISCFLFTFKLFNNKMLLFNLDGIYMDVHYVSVLLHMYETFHIKKLREKSWGAFTTCALPRASISEKITTN